MSQRMQGPKRLFPEVEGEIKGLSGEEEYLILGLKRIRLGIHFD